ncbi:MAG: tetratricopeptide repeat protein [Bacteroidales bacterium]|jgi:DNA-binding CsgD family transcriptional regulator/tetratricopeptide (TPR) repeat protein|nr:tetratricopeptide repeat protein [Bacteroidales bacterium]
MRIALTAILLLIYSSCISAANDDYTKLFAQYEQCYEAQDYVGSVQFLEKARAIIPEDSINWFADTYNGLTFAYWRLGNYTKAIVFGKRALELDRQIGDSANISRSLALLAAIFTHQRLYSDAEHYMRDAITMVPADNDMMLSMRLSTLGEILNVQKRTDEAIDVISRAYILDTTAHRDYKAAIRLSQLGSAYLQKGDNARAQSLLSEAQRQLEMQENFASQCINLVALAKAHVGLGNDAKAAEYAERCIHLCDSLSQRKTKLDALRTLAKIQSNAQLFEQALTLSDSLYTEQIQKQIAEFEVQYATAEKEKENAQLQLTIRNQRHMIIIFFIVLAALVISGILILIIKRMHRSIEHTETMAREVFFSKSEFTAAPQISADIPLDSSINRNVLPQNQPDDDAQLSKREIEIVLACCQGKLSKEIADELGISKRTVDNHKSTIYRKTGVCNNAELILWAAKHKLLKIE